MSEPNEQATAEPLAEAEPTPDTTPDQSSAAKNTTPDQSGAAQNTTPFWKRWLGKS